MIYPLYRIIWNHEERQVTVTAATRGYDGYLNDAAGALFELLSRDSSAIEVIRENHKDFIERCLAFGWLTEDGRINGSFTTAPNGPHLKRVQLELSLRCNLRCTYCYSESGPTQHVQLALDDIICLLDQAYQLGTTWIDLTGGEFFLYRDWDTVLVHARRLGLVVTVHTNGVLLTQAHVNRLKEVGVRQVQVSVDSHIPMVHDAVRGPQGSLMRTINGIHRAQDAGLAIRICVMVHQRNKAHIAETVHWLTREFGLPIALDRIIPAGGELQAQIGLSTREYYELISPLLRRNVTSTRICQNQVDSGIHRIEPHCGVAHSFVYITADGEIALCPTMTSRERPMFRGPSIHQVDLKTAWQNSSFFNHYRYLNCRNVSKCPTARACGGGCRSNAYLETGELDSPDHLECNMHKNSSNTFVDFRPRYQVGKFSVLE
jgi:radical SAM protein with 4Fe4S-binding SPASM domain